MLATDGVWDVMDNPGIVEFLRHEVTDAFVTRVTHQQGSFTLHGTVHIVDTTVVPLLLLLLIQLLEL